MSQNRQFSAEGGEKRLSLSADQSQALRSAFTDWLCRKVEGMDEETTGLDFISDGVIDLALLEGSSITLSPENLQFTRDVLLDFGQNTDETVKELVRSRYSHHYFDADHIPKRLKYGRVALELARQLASEPLPWREPAPETPQQLLETADGAQVIPIRMLPPPQT